MHYVSKIIVTTSKGGKPGLTWILKGPDDVLLIVKPWQGEPAGLAEWLAYNRR